VRKRAKSVFMAAPLTPAAKQWVKIAADAKVDGVWSSDHI
jgi:hypothetical protein